MTGAGRGPITWSNWQIHDAEEQAADRLEAVLYTDARISGQVREGLGPYKLRPGLPGDSRTKIEQLSDESPELAAKLGELGEGAEAVAKQLVDQQRVGRRVVEFVVANMPDAPGRRPVDAARIDWAAVPQMTHQTYHHRSRVLHDGTPFSAPMCESPLMYGVLMPEKPLGLASSSQGGVWVEADVPMLLATCEHLVRGVLLRWWRELPRRNSE
jgi:hypothetical protein